MIEFTTVYARIDQIYTVSHLLQPKLFRSSDLTSVHDVVMAICQVCDGGRYDPGCRSFMPRRGIDSCDETRIIR